MMPLNTILVCYCSSVLWATLLEVLGLTCLPVQTAQLYGVGLPSSLTQGISSLVQLVISS